MPWSHLGLQSAKEDVLVRKDGSLVGGLGMVLSFLCIIHLRDGEPLALLNTLSSTLSNLVLVQTCEVGGVTPLS